jgi:hypothetical protein
VHCFDQVTSAAKRSTLITENIMISELKAVGVIPTAQSLSNQVNMENNELIRRISTRNKKVPITMSKHFLW